MREALFFDNTFQKKFHYCLGGRSFEQDLHPNLYARDSLDGPPQQDGVGMETEVWDGVAGLVARCRADGRAVAALKNMKSVQTFTKSKFARIFISGDVMPDQSMSGEADLSAQRPYPAEGCRT